MRRSGLAPARFPWPKKEIESAKPNLITTPVIGQIIILGLLVEKGHVYQRSQEPCTPKPRKLPISSIAVRLWEWNSTRRSKSKFNAYTKWQIDVHRNADMCSNPETASYTHGQTRQRPGKTVRDSGRLLEG